MTDPITSNDYLTIDRSPQSGALTLVWKPATEAMTTEQFQEEMSRYADAAVAQGVSALFVDVREFRHRMADDGGAWRREHIIPRYNSAGVERFAFLFSEGTDLPPSEPAQADGPAYETRYFADADQAQNWLATGHALHIIVSYRVRDDVDLDEVRGGIQTFLAKVAGNHPGISYVSGQSLGDDRRFNHVVRCVDGPSLKALQAEDFFGEFGAFLKPLCSEPATVTRHRVAAAAGSG